MEIKIKLDIKKITHTGLESKLLLFVNNVVNCS